MPKGPRGEKRPADVVGNAVLVGRIAIGEVEDGGVTPRVVEGRKSAAKKGGIARTSALTKAQRSEIARKAAKARWTVSAEPEKKSHQEQ